jgi:hypothetical protein
MSPEGWERTMDRHARFGEHAIVTLHSSTHKLRTDQAFVITKMRNAYKAGRRTPPPPCHRPLGLPEAGVVVAAGRL